jgi:hypothetical protein
MASKKEERRKRAKGEEGAGESRVYGWEGGEGGRNFGDESHTGEMDGAKRLEAEEV